MQFSYAILKMISLLNVSNKINYIYITLHLCDICNIDIE